MGNEDNTSDYVEDDSLGARLHKAQRFAEGFHWEECNLRQCDGSSPPQEHQ